MDGAPAGPGLAVGGGCAEHPPKTAERTPRPSSPHPLSRPCVFVSACVSPRVSQGGGQGGDTPVLAGGGNRGVSYLPVLLQVVVEDLGVGLLMRGEDVHEGGGGIRRRRGRVDGPPAAQRRRQVEGGRRGSSVKSLLLEGLLRGDIGVRARTGRCSPARLHKRVPQRTTDGLC